MNWKGITGVLLVLGACCFVFSIVSRYRAGTIAYNPANGLVPAFIWIVIGIYLINKGIKKKTR